MMVKPDQAEQKYNQICMVCRSCVQHLLYKNGIDESIDNQMSNSPHYLLVHLDPFDNVRRIDIVNTKRGRIYVF